MTKLGGNKHLKRPASPTIWPIPRKGTKFVSNMNPGPHGKSAGMPVLILLRDVLKIGSTRKEIKYVLSKKYILVDGKTRTDLRFPVGHMDVVHLVPEDKHFRIQYHQSGKLLPHEISKENASFKIAKVIGKRNIRGNIVQISLHDGRNILLPNNDARLSKIKVNGSLRIKVPEQEILEIYTLKESNCAMVTEGRHRGKVGRITEIVKHYGSKASQVTFEELESETNATFSTALEYVFVVGEEESNLD